jgi:hypothetical protein
MGVMKDKMFDDMENDPDHNEKAWEREAREDDVGFKEPKDKLEELTNIPSHSNEAEEEEKKKFGSRGDK